MTKKTTAKDETTPHPIDIKVGARIRSKRKEKGLSQDTLAQRVRITFQQIQKYEHGTNRVSASRLVEICDALECSTDEILDGLQDKKPGKTKVIDLTEIELRAARAVSALATTRQQRKAVELIESMAA